eukprot:scaffold129889_cov19-Prasinocladus_malaysianus.AAC.1
MQVASGKLSSSTLGRYTCVALAGVSTEYLQYGVAEGGIGDVMQLDSLLKALNFSQTAAAAFYTSLSHAIGDHNYDTGAIDISLLLY